MKKRAFSNTFTISNGIEDVRGMKNFAYDGSTYYYFVELITGASPKVEVYRATSFTATKTLVTGGSLAPVLFDSHTTTSWDLYEPLIKIVGSDIYVMCIGEYENTNLSYNPGDYQQIVLMYRISGTWTIDHHHPPDVPAEANLGVSDIFTHDSKVFYSFGYEQIISATHSSQIQFFTNQENAIRGYVSDIQHYDNVYSGVEINSVYYWVVAYGSSLRIYSMDNTIGGWASDQTDLVENLSYLTAPTNKDPYYQVYWSQSNTELIMDQDYFRVRGAGDENFTELAAVSAPSDHSILIWNEDHTVVEYIIWDDIIWRWLPGGAIVRIAEYSGNAFFGMDDWFCDGTQGVQASLDNYPVQSCTISNAIYKSPRISLKTMSAPNTNQYLILYDDNDVQIGEGWIKTYDLDQQQYTYTIASGIKMDLKRKITTEYGNPTPITAKAILEFDSDEACDYLWYEGTSIGGASPPSTTFNYSVKKKTILDRLKWADARHGYIASFGPDCKLYWQPYRDSGVDIDRANTAIKNVPSITKRVEKFSALTLYGKDGAEVTVYGEPNFAHIFDWFEEVPQADLEALATQMVTDNNIEIQSMTITVSGVGQLLPGTWIDLTLPDFGITNEDWYITRSEYQAHLDTCKIGITDAYWAPGIGRDQQNLEQKTDNNQDRITVNETAIATKADDSDLSDHEGASLPHPTGSVGNALDSDKLNGAADAEAATASTIVKRDSAADINVRLVRSNYANSTTISGGICYRINNSTNNYIRTCSSASAIRTFIGAAASSHTHSYIPLSGSENITGDLNVYDGSYFRSYSAYAYTIPAIGSRSLYVDDSGTSYRICRQASSLKYKKNVRSLFHVDKIFEEVRPVIFQYKGEKSKHYDQYGFIAEELNEVVPNLVHHERIKREGKPDTFDHKVAEGYDEKNMIALLWAKCKSLQNQVDDLKEILKRNGIS